jgi:hypothetical protein
MLKKKYDEGFNDFTIFVSLQSYFSRVSFKMVLIFKEVGKICHVSSFAKRKNVIIIKKYPEMLFIL